MDTDAYTICNSNFTETIAVVCPKCGQQATVLGARADAPVTEYEKDVRFACQACGYAVRYGNTPKFTALVNRKGKAVRGRMLLRDAACDPFFGFHLWYTIEMPHGTLWAYNLAHLTAIEQYIADGKGKTDHLPQWATDAKYRELLLKLIRRFKR